MQVSKNHWNISTCYLATHGHEPYIKEALLFEERFSSHHCFHILQHSVTSLCSSVRSALRSNSYQNYVFACLSLPLWYHIYTMPFSPCKVLNYLTTLPYINMPFFNLSTCKYCYPLPGTTPGKQGFSLTCKIQIKSALPDRCVAAWHSSLPTDELGRPETWQNSSLFSQQINLSNSCTQEQDFSIP